VDPKPVPVAAKPAPVPAKPPVAKVQPITQGSAPSSVSAKPYRSESTAQRFDSSGEDRSSKLWIWAGVAIIALLLLIWALRPKHSAPVAGPTAPSASAQSKAGGNAWETKTIQPDGTASSTPQPSETKAAAGTATPKVASKSREQTPAAPVAKENTTKPEPAPANGNVWRTVIYTYNRETAADEKAKSLNAQHADLHAEVFSPSGNRGPFLVCAGGRMSKEDATQMRRKVVSMGLPHDSYIQNFKH
jgi:hypothetical protein